MLAHGTRKLLTKLTREYRHDVAILRPVIALHDQLMGSCDERKTIVMVERLGNILAEGVASATRGYAPAAPVIRVRPEQITHGSLVRHFLYAVECPNVIKRVDARGQPAVQTKDLVVDQGGEREVVEQIGEVLPDVGIAVLPQALVVEAVDLGDLAGLVVAAQNGDALWVSDLERNKQSHGLDGKVASVNIVACCGLAEEWHVIGAGAPMKR
jgi:hypothetical protein